MKTNFVLLFLEMEKDGFIMIATLLLGRKLMEDPYLSDYYGECSFGLSFNTDISTILSLLSGEKNVLVLRVCNSSIKDDAIRVKYRIKIQKIK